MGVDLSEPMIAPPPEHREVSVGAMFRRALALPFTHPLRMLCCGLPPCALLFTGSFLFRGWTVIGGANHLSGVRILYPLSIAQQRAPLPFAIWLLSFLVLGFWLCAWQSGTRSGFSDRLATWLKGSLSRTLDYTAALFVWLAASLATDAMPLLLIGRWRTAIGLSVQADLMTQEVDLVLSLLAAFPAFWVLGRLSPLPPLVAMQGWSGVFGQAWRLTRGHGFALTWSFLGCFVLGLVLAVSIGMLINALAAPMWVMMIIGIANLLSTALTLLWFATLGALIARKKAADAIDPTTFD